MSTQPRLSRALAWTVLILAVCQAAAVFIPLAQFGGEPNDSGVDLYISPAGYAFGIWAVIYVLSIVVGVMFVRNQATGTRSPRRLAIDLALTFAAAALWLIVSAADVGWIPSILLTVMAVALLDAARIAAGPADDTAPHSLNTTVRITVGIYAAWATAAVFVNWASDLGRTVADPDSLGWQLVILIAAAVVGIVATYLVGGALPAYPIVLVWAFVAIAVNAWSTSTVVVVCCAIAIVAVIGAYVLARGRVVRRAHPLSPATGS